MEFRVLGAVDVLRDGRPVELGAYRRRSLLALFLTAPNTVLSTDHIIESLWGDDGGDRQKALWVHVSGLRTALEPDRKKRTDGTILLTRPPGYLLSTPRGSIDAARFERQVEAARAALETDPSAAGELFRDALALWRGAPFADFAYEEFAQPEIARLEALRLDAIGARIDADLRCGRARELVAELEALVRQHPLREELTAQWMLALYRSGRQADALRAYGLLRSRLIEDLGLDPSAPLRRLEAQILAGDAALDLASSGAAPRHASGLTVRSYELRERIAHGPIGPTYRAHQASVGRDVAITTIPPDRANDPEFIRRFEAEAQIIAQLEHPHIEPLYDYWREPDAAYVVSRLSRGGDLGDLIERGPLAVDHVVRLAEQVGAALQAVHDAGAVHGDIRPGNIALDENGNAYLANFPIASDNPVATGPDAPSPAPHAWPGQCSGDPRTPASDVFGFGVVLAQALTGRLGPVEEVRNSMSPSLRDVIDLATHSDSTARPAQPLDVVLALRAAAGDHEPAADETHRIVLRNPYKGLRAFGAGDADVFAGRERIVADLLRRIDQPGPTGRLIALVGSSGSGKSSIIRAGVLPALRRGEVPGSERWFVTTLTPGAHPFEALEEALRHIAVNPPVDLLDRLTTEGIGPAVLRLVPGGDATVVVLVDQFEELFSQASRAASEAFMSAMAAAVASEDAPVRFLITLRADFYDRPLRHRAFGQLLEGATSLITPMSEDELERAMVAPAASVGVDLEPGLTAHIDADMAGQATALPLLQYALTELFEQRSGSTLTIDAYRRMGGISGALGRRAERLFSNLAPPDQTLTREIFVRLVALTDAGPDTRRRTLVDELSDDEPDRVTRIIESFGRARLLSFDRDPVSRRPTVEAAHEALLTEWARLRTWIDEARGEILLQRNLAAAAGQWSAHGKDPDFLLKGSQLGPYQGWIVDPPVRLTTPERAYLVACTEQAELDVTTERRRVLRLRRLVAVVATALVLALIAGGVALRQRDRAEQQTARALEEAERAGVATLISRSAAVEDDDPDLALLLALEARRRQPGGEADRAVLRTLASAAIASRISTLDPLDSDCDRSSTRSGREVAVIGGQMVARDAVGGDLIDLGPAPAPCAVGDRNGEIGFAQTPDGRRLWLGPNLETRLAFDQPTFLWEMTPARALLVRNRADGDDVLIVDTRTGRQVGRTLQLAFVMSAAQSPDGSLFVVADSVRGIDLEDPSEGSTLVIDAATGIVLIERVESVSGRVFVDDLTGELIVAAFDGALSIVDPATAETIRSAATGIRDAPIGMWARDDGTLIGAYVDRVRFIDVRTGDIRAGPVTPPAATAVLTAGRYLTVWSVDGSSVVYDLDGSATLGAIHDVGPGHQAIAEGRVGIVDRSADATVVSVADLASGTVSRPLLLDANGSAFAPLALFPAEDGLWAISADHLLVHWEDDRLVDTLYLGSVEGVVGDLWQGTGTMFGDYFAVHGRRPDRTEEAVVVRLRPGPPEVALTVPTGAQTGVVHPTIDGGLHLVDAGGTITTYDAAGEIVGTLATGARSPDTVALDASGTRLAVGSVDTGRIVVGDLSRRAVDIVPGVSGASTLGFNADGSVLVMSLRDGTIRLWDTGGGAVVTVFAGLPVGGAAEPGWYDAASDSIWMPGGARIVEVLLDPERWVDRACEVLGRGLTQTEWDLYVPGDLPLRPVCDDDT